MIGWPKTDSVWTDEATERLKQLWADGLSAEAVADELRRAFPGSDFNRNAVSGKIHRLGLSRSPSASQQASKINGRAAKPGAPPPPTDSHPWRSAGGPDRTVLHPAGNRVYQVAPDKPLPKSKGDGIARDPQPLEKRGFGACCYPLQQPDGSWLYCCNPGPKRIDWCYCEEHLEIMRPKESGAVWTPEMRAKQAERARMRNRDRQIMAAAQRDAA